MAGGSGKHGDSESTGRTTQSEREERWPSLVSLAFLRRATPPAHAASIDPKDWRRGVYEGLFFEDDKKEKTQKFWVDEKLHKNCLLVLPKAMYLAIDGEDDKTWRWNPMEEKCFGGTVDIQVPTLWQRSYLEIKGSFHTNALSPKTTYKVSFEVELQSGHEWPLPVNLELHLPDGSKLISTESLAEKPKDTWIELRVGEFVMGPKNVGTMHFHLHETCQIYKFGLVLKGLLVKPKD